MIPWFTESVRNKVLLVAGGGLLTAVIAYSVERWVEDDPTRAALETALQALVVIVVGTVITAVLDQRASARAAALEEQRRAAARSQLLERLGPNLKLAGTAWIHMPGLSAPPNDDTSVSAGLDKLEEGAQELGELELALKNLRETSMGDDVGSTVVWLTQVHYLGSRYWAEGKRPIRVRHLIGIRNALQAELADADDTLRAQFAGFASALDLAEAGKLKTDAVAQERLVVASVGEPIGASAVARENPAFVRLLQSISETGPSDSVLHVTIAADVLHRRATEILDDPPEWWGRAVYGTLNRCLGAMEHEVANVRIAVLRLTELVRELRARAGA